MPCPRLGHRPQGQGRGCNQRSGSQQIQISIELMDQGKHTSCISWKIWSKPPEELQRYLEPQCLHLLNQCDFICSCIFLGGRGLGLQSNETLRAVWGERSEHTQLAPRVCQPGRLGQEEKESSTYLCSSSSSSLDIIDLYWFPLSFPGLYLKENVSSAAGEGRQKKSKRSVNQRPPERHN